MEECGDILVFVKYEKNQTVGLWNMGSQSLQKLVKIWSNMVNIEVGSMTHGETEKLWVHSK